jgi:ATP-dependent 26S proteasome regulatory subunit
MGYDDVGGLPKQLTQIKEMMELPLFGIKVRKVMQK